MFGIHCQLTSSISEMTAATGCKFILSVIAVISDTLPLNEAAFAARGGFSVGKSICLIGGKCNAGSRLIRESDGLHAPGRALVNGRLSECCQHGQLLATLGAAGPSVRTDPVHAT